jgi:DNA-binding MarR family transcriptional regulator
VELVTLDDVPLGRLLVVAGRVAERRWHGFLAELGLTPAGVAVLMALHEHGEATHREMASRCFIRPATLTGVVDTLQRNGFVERRPDPSDRRSVRLALTPEGRARVTEIGKLIRSGRHLTSVDAEPAKAAVIREFLLELIGNFSREGDEFSREGDEQCAPHDETGPLGVDGTSPR